MTVLYDIYYSTIWHILYDSRYIILYRGSIYYTDSIYICCKLQILSMNLYYIIMYTVPFPSTMAVTPSKSCKCDGMFHYAPIIFLCIIAKRYVYMPRIYAIPVYIWQLCKCNIILSFLGYHNHAAVETHSYLPLVTVEIGVLCKYIATIKVI